MKEKNQVVRKLTPSYVNSLPLSFSQATIFVVKTSTIPAQDIATTLYEQNIIIQNNNRSHPAKLPGILLTKIRAFSALLSVRWAPRPAL
jgi:hypothetical protein